MMQIGKSYRPSRGFLISLGLIFLAGYFLFYFEVYRDVAFVCENTASAKGYYQWRDGSMSEEWYKTSSIDLFMREHYPNQLQHRWTSYRGSGKNVFGLTTVFSHGFPGPILRFGPKTLDRYMSTIDDSQKKSLYDLFASTNRGAIGAKVIEIQEKVWEME